MTQRLMPPAAGSPQVLQRLVDGHAVHPALKPSATCELVNGLVYLEKHLLSEIRGIVVANHSNHQPKYFLPVQL